MSLELVDCPDRRLTRAAVVAVAHELSAGDAEVCVLLPERMFEGGLHRILTLFTGPDQRTRIPRDAPAPHVTPSADEAPASHHEKEGTQ